MNVKFILEGLLLCVLIGFIFYEHIIGIIILLPYIYWYRKAKIKEYERAAKWRLNLEFGEGLQSISSALSAGYAPEHAIQEGVKDLRLIYDENARILREFNYMINQIKMNISVEETFYDLAKRTDIDDILSFAEVFATAKQRGGDLIQVIQISCRAIQDKVEVKREIMTMVAAKRMEANLMKFIPIGIILYLKITSPNYLAPLYHNGLGILLMSVVLLTYVCSIQWINRIMEIEI